jgi:hypothetical protein
LPFLPPRTLLTNLLAWPKIPRLDCEEDDEEAMDSWL